MSNKQKIMLVSHGMDGISKIHDCGLYMGNAACAKNIKTLKQHKITHVLNCATELETHHTLYDSTFTYMSLSLEDSFDDNLKMHLPTAIEFIDNAIKNGNRVLVHCSKGISRSGSLVVAYLMYKYELEYDDALKIAKKGRSCCNPNFNFKNQLETFDFKLLT